MRPNPREHNIAVKRNRLLHEIFLRERVSRLELARRFNMNPAMVGTYIQELMAEGLVVELEPTPTARGRSPVPVSLNPRHGRYLGLDFEALRARVVITDFAGNLVYKKEIPFTPDISRQKVLDAIIRLAEDAALRGDGPLLRVGVAAPGQVDVQAGEIIRYDLLNDFSSVPLQEVFQRSFNMPVFIEDNIRALTFAEMVRGAGRGCRHFLCLSVRSGVGLGMVINGDLYHGVNALAGELGYTVFPYNGRAMTMTELVSAVGLSHQAHLHLSGEFPLAPTVDGIIAAADAANPKAEKVLGDLGRHLGMIAANLANLFSPEKIVLVGEIPNCTLTVRQELEKTFRAYTLNQILKTTYIEDGALSVYAGALGAAYLGMRREFPLDSLPGQTKARR